MPKSKAALQLTQQNLSEHKFDTSTYIIFHKGVRRSIATGKLVVHKASPKGDKSKGK
jgi:hypothetical protein